MKRADNCKFCIDEIKVQYDDKKIKRERGGGGERLREREERGSETDREKHER